MPNTLPTRRTTDAVVVSSSEMPIVSPSMRRRLMRSACARATRSAARPGTRTVRVSNQVSLARSYPAARNPAASCVACPCTGDRVRPVGAVVDGVHRGHDSQEDLGGADVGGRLLAPDVLLPRLQGQPAAGARRRRPTRRRGGPGAHGGTRAAAARKPACGPPNPWARRTAATTRPASAPSSPGGTRRVQASTSVATTARPPASWRASTTGRKVADHPDAGVLQSAEGVGGEVGGRVADDHLDVEWFGAGRDHGDRLGVVHSASTKKMVPVWRAERRTSVIASAAAVPSSSMEAFVISMPVRSHTIVWKLSMLELALADLGLVGRVRGVPRGFSRTLRRITPGCGCRGSPGRSAT